MCLATGSLDRKGRHAPVPCGSLAARRLRDGLGFAPISALHADRLIPTPSCYAAKSDPADMHPASQHVGLAGLLIVATAGFNIASSPGWKQLRT